ncbi:glycosyl hydrolase 53 family protein [Paenibacillus harenae]|uniref:glycosyl hydrolase 53 family protein n=1 Tax=Paenibacillus harenae TaxID=306543 RepID=UPI0004253BF8|nr:glycosyl hydrolase 53 family protein [Paenibacillus harenae]
MKAWTCKALAFFLSFVLALTTMLAAGASGQASAAKLSDPDEFIKGVDISTLQAIEAEGSKKYYVDGQEKDLLAILKEHGVNYVRLRLWNNPVKADGFNDKEDLIAMAVRVKAAGMKLLVDFHYSDFWADPGKQVKPAAWQALDFADLKTAVFGYTEEVMNGLKAVNAYPDMVQIGNEINSGILLPEGSIGNFDQLAQLLKEGVKAVRDTTPEDHKTKIMLHLAEGGDNEKFRSFFDQVKEEEIDYDVIGMSYYPYWHGTFQQLKTNMNDMAARYDKQIVVAETAYPYTLENDDELGNIAGEDQIKIAGFPASAANQKLVTETVFNTIAHVDGGLGLGAFYWEPAWLASVGWTSGEGNGWENQAMFDFDGNALESLDAFQYVPGSIPDVSPILVYASPDITIALGETAVLPARTNVLYNEGTIEPAEVAWDPVSEDQLNTPGSFTVSGTVAGISQKAAVKITVLDKPNLVRNPGFESESLTNWTISGAAAGKVDASAANAHSGGHVFNYWNGSAYAYKLTQTITGLPNGTYELKAWASGGGGEARLQLFAEDFGGDRLSADAVNTGWNAWKQYTVSGIKVTNGQVTVGFDVEAPGDVWGNFDDFELVLVEEEPSIEEPPVHNPPASTPGNTPSPDKVTVSTGQLTRNGDGTRTVKLPAGTTEVSLPAGLYELLKQAPVIFSTDKLSVEIPSELFQELEGMLPDAGNSTITLKIQPVTSSEVEQLLAKSAADEGHTHIKLTGQAYGFHLSIKDAAGKETPLSQFNKPVTIRLQTSSAEHSRHAGIYYIAVDGSLDYVGGEWANGELIARIDHFSTYAALELTKKYEDVAEGHWAYAVIAELAAKQIVQGASAAAFEPERSISRAEFAALLARALKLEGKAEHPFGDVAEDAWYAGAVSAAYEAGITKGRSGSSFAPDALITRQEMAVMLMNAYALKTGTAPTSVEAVPFADSALIAEWAAAPISSAFDAGLIKGRKDNLFVPAAFTTRAEAAQAIYRLLYL